MSLPLKKPSSKSLKNLGGPLQVMAGEGESGLFRGPGPRVLRDVLGPDWDWFIPPILDFHRDL